MSSTLALQLHPTHSTSPYHMGPLTQSRATYDPLYGGSRSIRDEFQGGLPTPPATKEMTSLSVQNGNNIHTQQYLDEMLLPPGIKRQRQNGHEHETRSHSSISQSHPSSNGGRIIDQIATHLQIPESVNNSKGSIAEFAAEITCLFWFETSDTIDYAESLAQGDWPDRGLHPDAIPSIGFRKWVTTILSTTQVGKNVILLALMFIHRLKKFNRSVSGKKGSEFRLLTIALMLGNKFLDDNTYTNKTWAEVSGISVNEIHIMEVEFLSNMRYELYASEAQWQEWKLKLGKFGSFYEKALRFRSSRTASPTTPVSQTISHKLPSPPSNHKFTNGAYSTLPNPLQTLPHLPRSPIRQQTGSEYPFERKRSLDTSLDLPPAKRLHSSFSSGAHFSPVGSISSQTTTPNLFNGLSFDPTRLPQLPMPNLPNTTARPNTQLTPLSLPGPRSMSAIYPVTTSFSQPVTPTTTGPPNLPYPQMANVTGINNGSRAPSRPGSTNTSPTNMYGTTTPTRPGLSPSYFLMNRSSPYRPVRHVNTLLYPPPPTAMQNQVRNVGYDQMHYQTLSKDSNQLYSGPMPSVPAVPWQNQASTQSYRQY